MLFVYAPTIPHMSDICQFSSPQIFQPELFHPLASIRINLVEIMRGTVLTCFSVGQGAPNGSEKAHPEWKTMLV